MIKQGSLSSEELKVVNKIIDIQLASLRDITNRDIHRDLVTYCIQNSITLEQFNEKVVECQNIFKAIKLKPETLFSLGFDDLQTVRTILVELSNLKYGEGKRLLFRKFNILDNLNKFHTLN